MIRYSLFFLATASLLAAATGDVTVVGRSDGFSCDVYVEGFALGATINTGHTGAYNQPTGATPVFDITSVGYSGTTAGNTSRSSFIGHPMRKPYPDQAQIDADTTTVPGKLRIRFSLDLPLYEKDDVGAGNSGVAVTFTAPAGFIVNSGGGGQSSNAATAVPVTNDSTLAYPLDVSQWDWATTMPYRRKTGDFDVGVRSTSAFGLAAVQLDVTGLTSNVTWSTTITSPSLVGPMDSGLYYDSWKATVPISGFTQGEQLRLRYRAYPRVGTVVRDTESITTLSQRGDGRIEVTCDKANTMAVYGVVLAAGGSDMSGAVSGSLASARATPYATTTEAQNDGANVVILADDAGGQITYGTTPITSQPYAIEFRPDPLDVAANITLNISSGGGNTRCKHVYFGGGRYNVNFTAASTYLDGNTATYASTIMVDGVNWGGTMTDNQTPNVSRWGLANFVNTRMANYKLSVFGTTHFAWSGMGLTLDAPTDKTINEWGCLVASRQGTNNTKITVTYGTAGNPAHIGQNQMMEFNRWDRINAPGTVELFKWSDVSVIGNCSFRGNLITNINATSEPDFFLFNTGIPAENVLLFHNTFQGFPLAWMYESTGTTTVLKKNIFGRGNALMRMSIKSDTFGTPNANRTGNWWVLHGCGMRDNRIDGALFPLDWHGINAGVVGGNNNTNYTEMGYTNDASGKGTGLGGGDYTPTSSSILTGAMPVSRAMIKWDLFGTPVPASGDMEVGAILRASGGAPPPNTFPVVTITSPSTGATQVSPVNFTGTATDAEDGTISGSIVWTSSIDGTIGTGASISSALSAGTHTITATITDSASAVDTDSISLTVTAPPSGGRATFNRINTPRATIR